ncbi:hypothetical protein TIFTF001_037569 [Ficus carica]|uniref:Uncharacterized protein n=1 Tax=Ficus carica TaxID=3494 RepID=A0AA88E6E3_FICCA|nr:hypothetical protein TIFTF001_037569 [Ficus carica]
MPSFGTSSSTPAFGTLSSTPAFGTLSTTLAFETPSTPFFLPPAASAPCSPLRFLCRLNNNSNNRSILHYFSNHRLAGALAFKPHYRRCFSFLPSLIRSSLLKWLLSPFSVVDHDIQAIVEAYKDDLGNPKYVFKHLLFSVPDQCLLVYQM